MSVLKCTISGEVPVEPVVSTRSGAIFEKRLILKYIESEGKDPVSQEPLTPSDLVPVDTTPLIRPRPVQATSLSGLLELFQAEWDAQMLETFTLKQHLDATRHELSQALYQHDAACRVIARLIKERDEAKSSLTALETQIANGNLMLVNQVDDEMEMEEKQQKNESKSYTPMVSNINVPIGISESSLLEITDTQQKLLSWRKKRKLPEDLIGNDDIEGWGVNLVSRPHGGESITCMDVVSILSDDKSSSLVATGSVDNSIILSQYGNDNTVHVVDRLEGHTGPIQTVKFVSKFDVDGNEDQNGQGKQLLSGSTDRTVRLWNASGRDNNHTHSSYKEIWKSQIHSSSIVSLDVHATGNYYLAASVDSSWSFSSLETGQCLSLVQDQLAEGNFNCMALHPDGALMATGGSDSKIKFWNITDNSNLQTFDSNTYSEITSPIVGLAFSQNGYLLAAASTDATVRIWDLRKFNCLHTIECDQVVQSLAYDYSSNYLALGFQNSLSIYSHLEFKKPTKRIESSVLKNIDGFNVNCLQFGSKNSDTLFAGTSKGEVLRVTGAQ